MTRERTPVRGRTLGIALITFSLGYLLGVATNPSSNLTKPSVTVYEDGSVAGYGCLVGWPCDDRSNR